MTTLTTFLQESLKDNCIMRWPEKLMPLKIYVAPFRWYQKSKQQDSYTYQHMVAEALQIWSNATGGKFTFTITQDYMNSNVNVLWRRADRRSLGLCTINGVKDYMIYSAEVEIGISDGIIHAAYQDMNEVKHTIIHEMGHVIGLPHSPHPEDIMYVPHQYGVVKTSWRDINSANWLYTLEPGFNPALYMKDWGLESHCTIDELIWVYENQEQFKQNGQTPQTRQQQDKSHLPKEYQTPDGTILQEQEVLAYKNIYQLSLQHIKVDLNNKNKGKCPKNSPFTSRQRPKKQ
jgi:predicted Zn-dependent protease